MVGCRAREAQQVQHHVEVHLVGVQDYDMDSSPGFYIREGILVNRAL